MVERAVDEETMRALVKGMGAEHALPGASMAERTTFRIGGPAEVLVLPESEDEVVSVLDFCFERGVPYFVIGNGSDLLVGDKGIRGVVVQLGRQYSRIAVVGSRIRAQAGALLRDVALAAAKAGLSGMEPLWGIPASVGGACFMNAGAYGGDTAGVLESVLVYDHGAVRELSVDELAMGYRSSRIRYDDLVVLWATFKLEPGDEAEIRAAMEDYRLRREEKQPLELPSAGSTFKRPAGHFAGKLIMDAGLRGRRVGGAQVSEKHCGFVVNTGGATAADVRELIACVQDEVKRQFGVELEPEVLQVGEF